MRRIYFSNRKAFDTKVCDHTFCVREPQFTIPMVYLISLKMYLSNHSAQFTKCIYYNFHCACLLKSFLM